MSAAAALLQEEQLQQSLGTYEEDAEYEEDEGLAAEVVKANANSYAANYQLQNGMMDDQSELEDTENEMEEEGPFSDDEDAEGEDDDEMTVSAPNFEGEDDLDEDDEDDEDEDEDAEGVGAVKIQPGRLEVDDEDVVTGSEEDDDESAASGEDYAESKDASDVEVEAQWDLAADEDEEDEPINPNCCVFCQLDEEQDPSEIFEVYLACDVCGDNAHQQCARNADALKTDEEAEHWICPECVTNNLRPEGIVPDVPESMESNSPKISRDRVPGDLLPSQRGIIKPDSHSVFNQLITPDDPMDGSRLLRKRKTSPLEAESEAMTPARRKAREKISGSVTTGSVEHAALANSNLEVSSEAMEIDSIEPLTNGHVKKTEVVASPRSSRSLRPKPSPKQAGLSIIDKNATSLKVKFTIDSVELQNILSKPPKPQKKRRSTPARRQVTAPPVVATTSFVPSSYSQPFYSLHEKEVDELKSKPYGGILTEAEADTTLTLPKPEHRKQFDEARQKAEEEWKLRVERAAEAAALSGIKKPRKVSGPASQIEYIEFGQYQIDIWYAAPYPEEYSRNKALFICEFCLKYMESDIVAWRHKTKCHHKHPPGDEIYRDGKIMIFEVDGRKNPLYCQNLCLLAKLFLGSKTLYYDVEPFLFYVMTEYDEFGCHFVGYFSKEKRPSSLNNVSCILVLPIHQRKGYGHLLIDFSYLLTRVEKKTGSPEKPLSDMGLVSYRNYWRLVLCYYLRDYKPGDQIPSVRKMSEEMGLTPDDVISALDALGALIRDSLTGTYAFKLKTEYYKEVIRQHEVKGYARLNPKGLIWTPYIMGRGNASTFEHAPPLNGMGHQNDEDEENHNLISNGEREFEPPGLNGTGNGDTDRITDSIGMLSTNSNGGSSTPKINGAAKKLSYFEAAASIPPGRFEVFPPAPGTRKAAAPRPSASRPSPASRSRSSLAMTPSRPKPRSRPSTGSARRSATARPRSSGSRRKTGGTGRGPGRWPKGTTKKDFGDADSGPGLPPALVKARSRLGNEVLLGEEDDDDGSSNDQPQGKGKEIQADDVVPARTRRDRQSGRGLGKPLMDGKGKSIGVALGKGEIPLVENGGDITMGDADAEGEPE